MKTLQLAGLSLLMSFAVSAEVSDELLGRYYTAAQGDYSELDAVYEELKQAQEQDPSDAWTLFHYGAVEALKGDDAFLPWSKMRFTENGLARMDKALNMLDQQNWEQHFRGLPQALYMQASAAATFTSVPDFFKVSEQGLALFSDVIDHAEFNAAPAQATSWVYWRAIKAAKQHDRDAQAEDWYQRLQQSGVNDQYSAKAETLMQQG